MKRVRKKDGRAEGSVVVAVASDAAVAAVAIAGNRKANTQGGALGRGAPYLLRCIPHSQSSLLNLNLHSIFAFA
jgi:hypothetical protein